MSQNEATNGELFTQDVEDTQVTEVDVNVMNAYMGPAAVDGFMGFGNEMTDVATEQQEQIGIFDIPREFLLKLPIAHVASDTRIIALNTLAQNDMAQVGPNTTEAPTPGPSGVREEMEVDVRPNNPQAQKPGPSGVGLNNHIKGMETDEVPENRNVANPDPTQVEQQPNPPRPQGVPKKGFNTKNKRKEDIPVCPLRPPTQDNDATLQDRMNILQEIAELVRNSKGRADMTELQLWGQYMGMKAGRIPGGQTRDEVLVEVEKVMNKGIHGRWGQEE